MNTLFDADLKNAQLLKDLFDQALDLIQIAHLDGTLLYINKSWSDLLEYPEEEILGKSIYYFVDEPDQEHYRNYRKGIIEGTISGKPIVFKLKSKSGKLLHVEGAINLKKENNKPLYTRGIFRDITPRIEKELQLKEVNAKLQEREHNLHQLLIHAPDAVIVINKESRIVFWNPKAETIFGWEATEVLNQPLQDIIIPVQYREAHIRGMKHYLSTSEGPVLNNTIEVTALRKSGQEFHISLTISPTTQKGETAFIAFIRDITEQKLNQLELERKTKEMEQFTHVSHHDLQEPLRKIIMYSDLVISQDYENLSQKSKRHLDKIVASAHRMSTALKDILNFASLSQEEQFTIVDLEATIAAVKEDLELIISEKNAAIISHPLPSIKAVPMQMHQLFYNLINNALKFTRTGIKPVINIECRKVAAFNLPHFEGLNKGNHYYQIKVSDNGIGFEASAAEKIFGLFQRLHNRETFSGTGIGLALCKKVLANHGGVIWAESKEGEGADFIFLLPAS